MGQPSCLADKSRPSERRLGRGCDMDDVGDEALIELDGARKNRPGKIMGGRGPSSSLIQAYSPGL